MARRITAAQRKAIIASIHNSPTSRINMSIETAMRLGIVK